MRIILLIYLTVTSLTISAQENPFGKLKYDKVVAFEFNGNGNRSIDKVLTSDRKRIDNQIELDSNQIKRFEEIISKRNAYGQTTAACFDPHFAVVYYLNDSIVAQVNICLMCNYLKSTERIPSVYQFKEDEGTEYERVLHGFSKDTRKDLDDFIASLNFNKYRKSLESIFDN